MNNIQIVFISVVRDHEMFRRCLSDNPHVKSHTLHMIDNRLESAHISVQYNRFLDAFNFATPAWLIFCHEDFEIKEGLERYFEQADKTCLYGPIGALTKVYWGCLCRWKLQGAITESKKDGSSEGLVGTPVKMGTPVETFDCQCLIVHSDLIQQTGLRFDPELSFDLYIEDFCIQAKEKHNIQSLIMPFSCKHWSNGWVGDRYYKQEEYLRTKYRNCCYTGTSSYNIGTPSTLRRWNAAATEMVRMLIKFARYR